MSAAWHGPDRMRDVRQGDDSCNTPMSMGFVAFQLAARNGDMLVGSQASAEIRKRIGDTIAGHAGIVGIAELLVSFIGPRRVWVVARVDVDEGLSARTVLALARTIETSLQRQSPFIARADIVPRDRQPAGPMPEG